MIKQQLQDDVKAAMLAGDALRLETLRCLKSVIQYAEVAGKKRDAGLGDDEILVLFAKEAKKRQESAELYLQGGSKERADKEHTEQAIIETYLPARVDDATVAAYVAETVAELGATSLQQMGQVIAAVRQKIGPTADGALIAKLTKERLS